MLPAESPFKVYTGLDGQPLNNGYVYFGVANQNPITSPITVYWDAAGTQPALQPLRTEHGYIVRNGTPANVFVDTPYSEIVKDAHGRQVFYARTSDDFSIASTVLNFITNLASSIGSSLVGFIQSGLGAVLRTVQDKLRDSISVKDFGAKCDGVTDDTVAVQAAIIAASLAKIDLLVPGLCVISSTLNMPSNTFGCTIRGGSRRSGFKYTGASGALLASLSTNHFQLRDLTLAGPGSSINTTAISCATSNSAVGVYYCAFERVTIEGFQTGMAIAGLTEATFRDIKIGLAKSGVFTGTDQEACPLIGIDIGTTVLAAQFDGLTIFAKRRCVQQTTQDQLDEGLYFFGCTFDLSFNDGANANQSCIYFESGQDVVFTACWFTNTQKFDSHSSPFSDNLVRIAYNAGTIAAPLVSFKFMNCSFVGNSMSLQFGNNVPNVREVEFVGNVFRLWANLGKVTFGGYLIGMSMCSNVFTFYGDSAVGGTKYDLPTEIINLSNISGYSIVGNTFRGILPINNATCYILIGGTDSGLVADNLFPSQTALSAGSEVADNTSNTNVIALSGQQSAFRQLSSVIAAATYNAGNPTLASINTGLTKPRMAIVDVNLTLVSAASGGFLNLNQGDGIDQTISYTSAGTINIQATRIMIVSGTVALNWSSGGALTVSANSSKLKITYI